MKNIPYLRIGTSYYRLALVPTTNKNFNEILLKWDQNTIIQDHGKPYLNNIPKYIGKVCFPTHFDFSKEYNGFYNTYSQLRYAPKEGTIVNTLAFFEHIFGNQIQLGLDYFKLLYEKPHQILPVLCLVSKERATAKSTFLKYLNEVFGKNMTFLDSANLSSNFNLDWGNKLILGLDEAFFQREEITEKIKYLSTSNINKIEAKGFERFEVEFFGKFILCSNKEDSFIKIDSDETRFWVIKVPKIKLEDVLFLDKLISEIPAFLDYTLKRNFSTGRKTRMWFSAEEIYTPALKKLMNNNRNNLENIIAEILLSVIDKYELESVEFIPLDLLNALNRTRVRTSAADIKQILKKDWKLTNLKNSFPYKKITVLNDGDIILTDSKGRYYSVEKTFLINNFDDSMIDNE